MKGNRGIGIKKDPRLKVVIEKLAKELNLPVEVINKVAISQFKTARKAVNEQKNIRFIKLFMLYNRHNKSKKYLDIKKAKNEN
jgi:hypothetical protein